MKYDIFEFNSPGMTLWDKTWRIAFVLCLMLVWIMDLIVWRP